LTDTNSMKLLILLTAQVVFLFSNPLLAKDRVGYNHDHICKNFGINLPEFPSRFVKWTRRERTGCLVEDKDQIIQQFLSKEEREKDNAHQIAACKCLASKSKLQRWLYHNKGKKSDWVDQVVWKKVGDHFRGRMYENFTDMLRWDNMLKQGEINQNYLKYAEQCYFKKITNNVNKLINGELSKAHPSCNGKKDLINKRVKLIFGKNKIEDFVEDFKNDLSDVVKNKISEEHKSKNYCMSYKNYLAMKSPSRIRYEIMEKFRTEECKSDMKKCYQDFKQMFAVKTSHAGPYYTQDYLNTTLGKVSEDKMSFVETIQDQLKSSRRSAIDVNSQLRDDPFIQALLNEQNAESGGRKATEGFNFFKRMVKAKDADIFFTDPKNIKKVFEQRNEQCGQLASPEILSKLLCEDSLPPISMDAIQEDLGPELTRSDENNHFGNKATEYLTAKYMCTTKKEKMKDEEGKKHKIPAWTPIAQDKAYQDLMDKVLRPRNRMVSDLEIQSLKKTDPTLKVKSDYERFNEQVCNLPKVKKMCGKKGDCTYLREIANSGTIKDLIAQHIADPEKQKAIYDLIKSFRRPYRTTDPESGELSNLLMGYFHSGIDPRKTNPKDVYYIIKNILDMNHLVYGSKRAQDARIIHSMRDTDLVKGKLDEIKADPTRYKALKESLGLSEEQDVDLRTMSKEDFYVFAKEGFGGFDQMRRAGEKSVPEGSAAARALSRNSGEVIGDETGGAGTSYFTDYNLGADQATEDAINQYTPSDTQLSSTWVPPVGGDMSTNSDDAGVPYDRTVNVDPTTVVTNAGDNGVNGDNGLNGVNGNNGTPTVFNPGNQTRIVGQPTSVVTTRRTSFSDPDATIVNIGGQRRVMVPTTNVGANEGGDSGDDVDTSSPVKRAETKPPEGPTRDENMDRIEQNLKDYETLDKIAEIRKQLTQEQEKTRRTLHDLKTDRELAKFNTGGNTIAQGNILPSNFVASNDVGVSGANYTPTYGVSTNSSKKSDFDHVMKNGELPGSSGPSSGGRGPASAGGGATGLGALGIGGGISGSALGGIAEKLNMKDPSVLKAIKNASIQLQAENVFPYQLVQEMGIAEVVGTFGLEGQTFYALEIKDYNFTLHKIDLSKKVVEEGGLSGKRKELLASLTLLRGTVGAEATFKQIQNSYVVESSKTLSTNEDKKKLFLKTMTYEELDKLLVTAVHKELKIKQ
jgi:hypothetical protein